MDYLFACTCAKCDCRVRERDCARDISGAVLVSREESLKNKKETEEREREGEEIIKRLHRESLEQLREK